MNLTQLECFLAVAEELHFGRAAQRLYRSPATVSEAIAALEHVLGDKLFDRTSRRVQLTAYGRAFLNEVKGPYAQLLRAHENAIARASAPREVQIAHTPELGHLLLPGLYASTSRQPQRSLPPWKPTLMHTQEQLRAVEAGTIDIGLCWSVPAAPPLRKVVLRELPVVAVLCDDDPLAAQPAVHLEQLKTREVVMTPRSDNAYHAAHIQLAFTKAGLHASNIREVPRYEELVLQVAAGHLVGLHAATIVAANRVPDMVFRPLEPTLSVSICALLRRDRTDVRLDGLLDALRRVADGVDLAGAPVLGDSQ
ncbi:MAG: LysR family transcriptional regulator [Streptomyces sp.]|nr:LysR family transcriptional regulator [Streptomyces sp.]